MPDDAGFMTPMFGAAGMALAIVATASLYVAQSEERASRRSLERLQELYRAEGVATLAAWRILHFEQGSAAGWDDVTTGTRMKVWVEAEDRKLGLAELGGARGRARLATLLDRPDADELVGRLGGGALPRERMRHASDDPAWRRCGLSLVSLHSRLTDNGLDTAAPVEGEAGLHLGEVWRVVVSVEDRTVIDRVIRFTGAAGRPVAVLDQLSGGPVPDGSCIAKFQTGGST